MGLQIHLPSLQALTRSHVLCALGYVSGPHQPTYRRRQDGGREALNFTGIRIRRDGRPSNFPNHTNARLVGEYGKKKPPRISRAKPGRASPVGANQITLDRVAPCLIRATWRPPTSLFLNPRERGAACTGRPTAGFGDVTLRRRQDGALAKKAAEERARGRERHRHARGLASGRNAPFPALDRHVRNSPVLALERRQ